jgi:hypothetical protein
LILFSHQRLSLPSGLFPFGVPTKILYESLLPHACYMPCPSHPLWLDNSNYTLRRVLVMKLLIMQFSPTFDHFSSVQIFSSAPTSEHTIYIYIERERERDRRNDVTLAHQAGIRWTKKQLRSLCCMLNFRGRLDIVQGLEGISGSTTSSLKERLLISDSTPKTFKVMLLFSAPVKKY